LSQSSAVPQPTEIAGRYLVIQKLGAGAFGTVYKAKDKILGRLVAIKTIRLEGLAAQGASLDELMERFNREAQVSAQLKHPNIVTIYDVGQADAMNYLAMEFIDGVGLDRIIAEAGGKIPVTRAAQIAAQVADALDFAHKNSVIHRDIKPANIMIEAGDRVKVTDFGIAKVTTSGEHLTVTGSLLGTPSYMSPEQARGTELDGRSDLFAVGCILYELLTGKKAFRGESITGLIFKIITEEPPPIHEIEPELPESVVRIVNKALSKAPEMRYQTGRELADDLLALTHPGSSPTLRQAETPTSPGLAPTSPPTMAAPTAHSAPTRATAPATRISAPQRVVAPPPAPAPAPTPKRSGLGLLIVLGLGGMFFLVVAAAGGWYFFLRTRPSPTGVEMASAASPAAVLPSPAVSAAASPEPPRDLGGNAASPAATPAVPAATQPPPRVTRPPVERSEDPVTRPVETPPLRPPPTKASILDEPVEDQVDGRQLGKELADSFRSKQQGFRPNTGSSYGTSRPLAERERTPKATSASEHGAFVVLRRVANAENQFEKRTGHYGTLSDLVKGGILPLDVPYTSTGFAHRDFRYELTVQPDGYRLAAIPQSGGPGWIVDDTGYIRRPD